MVSIIGWGFLQRKLYLTQSPFLLKIHRYIPSNFKINLCELTINFSYYLPTVNSSKKRYILSNQSKEFYKKKFIQIN